MAQVATRQSASAGTSVPAKHVRGPRQRYTLWQRLRANLYGRLPLFVESLVALALIILVVLADVLYYLSHGIHDIGTSLQDAVGLLTLNPAVRTNGQAGTALFVFNVLFSLVFIQSILSAARAIVSRRRPEQRQRGMAAVLNDHVIVCGMGRMGFRLITRLVEADVRVAVIERDWHSEFVSRALAMRVPVIEGDAREIESLRHAGLNRARAIVACIDGDLVDAEIALAARAAHPRIRAILRAFNEDFDRGMERQFGAHTAFSASALAAPTFAAAAVVRHIEHVVPLDSQLLLVTSLTMPAIQPPGPTLRSFEERFHVRALRHIPASGASSRVKPPRSLATGDRLTVIGVLPAIQSLYAAGYASTLVPEAAPMRPPIGQHDRVIVCGLGKVGYRVVSWLKRMPSPPHITIVHLDDDEHKSFSRRIGTSPDVSTVFGDARDRETLLAAGIEDASVVLAVTSEDLINLQIALEARRIRPDAHIVLRVFSDSLAQHLVELFGIHTAYSTSELASSTLAAAAIVGGVSHAFASSGKLYAMSTVAVKPTGILAGSSILDVVERFGAVVAGLQRENALTVLPAHDMLIMPYDELSLVAPLDALARLRRTASEQVS